MSETIKGSVTRLADEYGSTRRRTQRVKIAIPIAVRIPKADASFYEEATETVVVNANGCLTRLAAPVTQGQQIHVFNSKSTQEQACAVVWIGKFSDGKTEVGLEFSEPAPRFWRIVFPPEDWNPADRKLPTAPQMPQPSTSK
jgi:hypothetical protein